MAEKVSKQAAYVAAGTKKQMPVMGGGSLKVFTITSPNTVTWANGDTCASPITIPKGSRIIGANVSCADMGTSITLDVGLRQADTAATVIDADGIVAALDVATAAVAAYNASGALCKDGVESITAYDANAYFTLNGGTPTANAQIRVDVLAVVP
jgi:hypothetical protein